MGLLDLMLATPPWLPLAMVGVLLALLVFLYWSLSRNLRRIDLPDETPTARPSTPVSPTE